MPLGKLKSHCIYFYFYFYFSCFLIQINLGLEQSSELEFRASVHVNLFSILSGFK